MIKVNTEQHDALSKDLVVVYQRSVTVLFFLALQFFLTAGSAVMNGWGEKTQSALIVFALVVLVYLLLSNLNTRIWNTMYGPD
jgi:hypothetical protein